MFESLSDRLSGILDKLTRRGSLTDSDVSEAMREVRRALLEANRWMSNSSNGTCGRSRTLIVTCPVLGSG